MKHVAKVIKGQGRGAKIGFPTFNLKIPKHFSAREGIYACWVWIGGKKYKGALHFGPIPVFNQKKPSLEIHLIDYVSASPLSRLVFEVVKYLRPVKNFSSLPKLSEQISSDVRHIRRLLNSSF